VPGPDPLFPAFDVLLAYGPVPGVELIPYFLGLLAWVGLALCAVFRAPFTALIRRFRRAKSPAAAKPDSVPEQIGDRAQPRA
jgi:hypothetical protein